MDPTKRNSTISREVGVDYRGQLVAHDHLCKWGHQAQEEGDLEDGPDYDSELGIVPTHPSAYPQERTRRRERAPSTSSQISQQSTSPSASDTDAEDEVRDPPFQTLHYRPRPAMSIQTTFVPLSLGKPPQLTDLSPHSLVNFLLAFKLYFNLKDVTATRKKILMVGLSITNFTELNAWWTGSMSSHLAKTYEQFVRDLKREALPRDYVWEVEREIRESRQRGKDYGEWSGALRLAQQAISTAAMTDLELVKNLLYGMDDELARYLRQHEVLLGTGHHEDDRDAIGLGANTPTLAETANDAAPATTTVRVVDYGKFDRAARDQWTVILARRLDVARQLGSAKKGGSAATTTKQVNHGSTPANPSSPAAPLRSSTPAAPATAPGSAALTPLERAYLSATYGCTKCRKPWQKHRAINCTAPISRDRVVVPSTFQVGDTVTPPASFTPSSDSYVPTASASSASASDANNQKVVAGLRGFSLLEDIKGDDGLEELDWSSGTDEE
ncbi:hypothetical protein JCM11641_007204 [Rhodosporidiobolus odoratus]